jgi:hypothetical protein
MQQGHSLMKREASFDGSFSFRFRSFTKFIVADPAKPEATISRGILVGDQNQLFLNPGYPVSPSSATIHQTPLKPYATYLSSDVSIFA